MIYTKNKMANFLIDVFGYSQNDCNDMSFNEMLNIIEENQSQYDLVSFYA